MAGSRPRPEEHSGVAPSVSFDWRLPPRSSTLRAFQTWQGIEWGSSVIHNFSLFSSLWWEGATSLHQKSLEANLEWGSSSLFSLLFFSFSFKFFFALQRLSPQRFLCTNYAVDSGYTDESRRCPGKYVCSIGSW
jgi:hypothetical protein